MFKREKKFRVVLTDEEWRLIMDSLLTLRNNLLAEGSYADAVNEMIEKLAG